jgi:hypothetical protein
MHAASEKVSRRPGSLPSGDDNELAPNDLLTWKMKLLPLDEEHPKDAYRWQWRKIEKARIGAMMDNARRLAREREVAGIPLKGKSAMGGKSIRHLSREWLAERPAYRRRQRSPERRTSQQAAAE